MGREKEDFNLLCMDLFGLPLLDELAMVDSPIVETRKSLCVRRLDQLIGNLK